MIQHIIDNIYLEDWNETKCVYEKEVFDEIFTVTRESPFVGNHYYGFVDGAYPENERLLTNAIDDLLEIRDND